MLFSYALLLVGLYANPIRVLNPSLRALGSVEFWKSLLQWCAIKFLSEILLSDIFNRLVPVPNDVLHTADVNKVCFLRCYFLSRNNYCMQSAILCWKIRPSVCPSVRHSLVLYLNECTYRQTLSTVW